MGSLTRVALNPASPVVVARKPLSMEFLQHMNDPVLREQNRQKGMNASRQAVRKLTWRQNRFVAEYLADPKRNVYQAAIRAGYTENTAYSNGCSILRHPQSQAIIQEVEKKALKRLEISAEKVLQSVAACAFSNVKDYLNDKGEVDIRDVPEHAAYAVQDYTIDPETKQQRIKLVDKLTALNLLGRNLKLFDNSAERSGLTINFLDKVVAGEISVDQLKQIAQTER
jgi:phage terminase small subunit